MADRRTWPYGARDPVLNRDVRDVYFATPNGYQRSDRDLAGPLRMGTTPEVGPKGAAVWADRSFRSDYGMDRVDGTASTDINKGTSQPPPPLHSDLIAREIRGRRRDD